jgi:hypothetical protein
MKSAILWILPVVFLACTPAEQKEDPGNDSLIKTNPPPGKLFDDLRYAVLSDRKNKPLQNDSLKTVIDRWIESNNAAGIDSLVNFLLEMTKDQLQFSFGKSDSDPEKLVHSKKANCVGYAAYFNSACNYALQKSRFNSEYECRHCVGKIYADTTEITALFNDPFFNDHDFNVIRPLKGGKDIVVDPSLYEYLGISRIRLRE